MQITTTTSADTIINTKLKPGVTKTIIIKMISSLERVFKTKLLIEIDPKIYPTNTAAYLTLIPLIKKLQSLGIIRDVQRNERIFHDEPNLLSYRTLPLTTEHAGGRSTGYDVLSEERALAMALAEQTKLHAWRHYSTKNNLPSSEPPPGLAIGSSKMEALVQSLLQLVTHEVQESLLAEKVTPHQLDIASLAAADARMLHIYNQMERYGLELSILLTPTNNPFQTVVISLSDSTPNELVIGYGSTTGFDLFESIITATNQALAMRITSRMDGHHNQPIPKATLWQLSVVLSELVTIDAPQTGPSIRDIEKQYDSICAYFKTKHQSVQHTKIATPDLEDIGYFVYKTTLTSNQMPLNDSASQ